MGRPPGEQILKIIIATLIGNAYHFLPAGHDVLKVRGNLQKTENSPQSPLRALRNYGIYSADSAISAVN
jgi:hypothetical protein